MSTKRTGGPKGGVSKTTTTTVETTGLTAEEERAIRMRFGLAGDDDLVLPDKAHGNADIMAKLKEIEARAFAATGRSPLDNGGTAKTKAKIVSALKSKSKPQ